MLNISLLALTLWGDILVEPFRIAEAESGHHQGCLRAAMAPDGRFAIMWRDSLPINNHQNSELELFVRFFNSDGNPSSEAYKIIKLVDTNYIYGPCLDMDTSGNTVLLWSEGGPYLENTHTRFQVFASDGSPMDSARIMCLGGAGWYSRLGLSIANNGEFAVVCPTRFPERGYGLWVQRFDLEGVPQDSLFLAHDTGDIRCEYPQVALNDAGDLVVTWRERGSSPYQCSYPRFQVFDAEDESILPWEPMGHRLDDGEERYSGTRAETFWLDDDRFVVFWINQTSRAGILPHPVGRVFTDRGLTRHPIRSLVHDSLTGTWVDPTGRFAVAMSSDERFAETHTRSHYDYPDTSNPWKQRNWEHGGGILGYIQNNEPIRRTTLFEYTPPLGEDTINSIIDNWPHIQFPAVGVCENRIVWVYSRLNTDTIFEAFAMITDWDMGIGVEERPVFTQSPIRLSASLNRLFYDVSGSVTGQARLTLYSSDGRKVLEETIKGKGMWDAPVHLPQGVYFARVEGDASSKTQKVVLIR